MTSEGLRICKGFRSRRFPWGHITGFVAGRSYGARCVEMVLTDDRTIRLPAPIEWIPFRDELFDQKFADLARLLERNRV